MKKIVLLASACLLLTAPTLQAKTFNINLGPFDQEAGRVADDYEAGELRTFKIKLGNSKDQKVVISMFNSGVTVIGHNSDEVVIETANFSPPPKQAEGLRPLYNKTEDNTQLGLGVNKDGNNLTIAQASRHGSKYTIRVPKNVAVTYREVAYQGDNFTLSDVNGEIEIKLLNGSATLTNISGPVVANTTNGHLKIRFAKVDQSKPSAISSINGDVDITLPTNTKANFKLKSINGEIYTDFDLNMKKDTKSDLPKIGGGNNIDGQINGGGVDMSIQTINNDIFIRKSK
jgi:Putative adhesin